MRLTPDEFDVMAFWTVPDVLDMLPGIDRRKARDWLYAGGVVQKNAAGARICTRAKLEAKMPEVLEAMRRAVVAAYDQIRQGTVGYDQDGRKASRRGI